MQEDGSVLIFTLILIISISVLAMGMLSIVGKAKIITTTYQQQLENRYLLQAALVKAKFELKKELGELVTNDFRACDLDKLSKSGQVTINNLLAKETIVVIYDIQQVIDESSKLNINCASKKQLRRLSGIGNKLGTEIYQRRIKNKFAGIEEIQAINGIGEEKYKQLKPFLTVDTVGRININTSFPEVLVTLKGIGPIVADNIITYRKTNGGFNQAKDLEKVSGIGAVTYQNIAGEIKTKSDLFTLNIRLRIPKRNIELSLSELIEVGD